MKIFDFKSPDYDKLISYGFAKQGEKFVYTAAICGGQFVLRVEAAADGVKTLLTDACTGEPYTLHLIEGAEGAFVGAVRGEYERALADIAEKCFYADVFKSAAARTLLAFARERYGEEPEFLWKKLPAAAVLRRKDNRK